MSDDNGCWSCGAALGHGAECDACGAMNQDWDCATEGCDSHNTMELWPICPECGMDCQDDTFDHELAIHTIAHHLRTWGYEEGREVRLWVPKEQDELEDRILYVCSQIVEQPGEDVSYPTESWSYAGPSYEIDQGDDQFESAPPAATRFRVNAEGELIHIQPDNS